MLERRLGGHQCAPNVDAEHAIDLIESGLLEWFRNRCAGIVDEYIETAECRDRLLNCAPNGLCIGGVSLKGGRGNMIGAASGFSVALLKSKLM